MRFWLGLVFAAGLLAGMPPARAQAPTMRQLTVEVGQPGRVQLEFPVATTVCDDLSLLRLEDGGDHIRVVGLKPGRTKCGFWRLPDSPVPTVVYDIAIRPAARH
jgi:hypothetical protein